MGEGWGRGRVTWGLAFAEEFDERGAGLLAEEEGWAHGWVWVWFWGGVVRVEKVCWNGWMNGMSVQVSVTAKEVSLGFLGVKRVLEIDWRL